MRACDHDGACVPLRIVLVLSEAVLVLVIDPASVSAIVAWWTCETDLERKKGMVLFLGEALGSNLYPRVFESDLSKAYRSRLPLTFRAGTH